MLWRLCKSSGSIENRIPQNLNGRRNGQSNVVSGPYETWSWRIDSVELLQCTNAVQLQMRNSFAVYQLTSRFLYMPSTIILGFGPMCEERLGIVH